VVFKGLKLSSAYPADNARRGGFSAAPRGDADRTYRAALRHSRHVRWLRIGVPAAIAVALLIVVAANYAPTVGGLRLPGDLGQLVIKGTKVTMQQPRLTGFTTDSRPYDFTADTAEQDITKPDLMELHRIHAKIEMEDKSMVNLAADNGRYDMKNETLTLVDNIHVVSSTGYEARLSEATVDVHKGTVMSDKPVWVKLTNGELRAKRLEVLDSGDVIRFSGGVQMTVNSAQLTQADDQ
jgi:lipopolysaccharide export system protein LptC